MTSLALAAEHYKKYRLAKKQCRRSRYTYSPIVEGNMQRGPWLPPWFFFYLMAAEHWQAYLDICNPGKEWLMPEDENHDLDDHLHEQSLLDEANAHIRP